MICFSLSSCKSDVLCAVFSRYLHRSIVIVTIVTSSQQTITMDRTDEELDRDWKPNGRRPQSYVALPSPITAIYMMGPWV